MVSLVGQSIASATHLAGKTEGNTVFISKDEKTPKRNHSNSIIGIIWPRRIKHNDADMRASKAAELSTRNQSTSKAGAPPRFQKGPGSQRSNSWQWCREFGQLPERDMPREPHEPRVPRILKICSACTNWLPDFFQLTANWCWVQLNGCSKASHFPICKFASAALALVGHQGIVCRGPHAHATWQGCVQHGPCREGCVQHGHAVSAALQHVCYCLHSWIFFFKKSVFQHGI